MNENSNDFKELVKNFGYETAKQMTAKARLEYLRGEIRAERISYGEIAELVSLKEHIDPSDVELLQWAGVEENDNSNVLSVLEVD